MNQMQQMLMQAQRLQKQILKAHEELDKKEFTTEKAGLVTLVMKGDRSLVSLSINEDALDKENKEMLEETIKMAVFDVDNKLMKANGIAGLTGIVAGT